MLRREPPERLWMRAASFAARAHGAQRRKDGLTPYFAHPARVAVTVAPLDELPLLRSVPKET